MSLNDDTFDEQVLKATVPVVVVFFAPGCKICDTLRPVVFGVAKALPMVKFKAMNALANPKTAERYALPGYPAMIMFRDGQPVGHYLGGGSLVRIVSWIKGKLTCL